MKKQLLLTITLLICVCSYAQITVKKSSDKTVDEMLKNIDKTSFTSGILVDRSGNYANLAQLNSSEKSISINYAYFKQAILDLHIASNKEKFISSKALKESLAKNNQEGDIVDIGIISADFHSLNYQFGKESGNGLELEGNVFKQVKNKEAFLHHTSLVASPLKMAAKGTTITYRFQDEFWFNSSKKDIKNLTAHFQNGGEFTIIENGKIIRKELQQNYTKNGEKMITFIATYSDNSQLTCKSKIYIIAQEMASRGNGCIENDHVFADPAEAFQGYDETTPIRGRMDYRIYFRTNSPGSPCNLVKPIIIIDGFDPGDRRRFEDADCANDPNCADKYISNGQFVDSLHTSIREFLNPTDGTQNLGSALQSLGYDVILVNNPTHYVNGNKIDGGADYIERNGKTLIKLIKDVNIRLNNNGSNEKLVIVGPSMGGQISRFALAYMEKMYAQTGVSEWQHNTRLWISVDSPHLGANIPLGVQALLSQVKNQNDAAQDFVDNQLGSPAAKQQLIEQYTGHHQNQLLDQELDGKTVSQGFSSSRGSLFFQNFYNELFNNGLPGSKGYPQNLRKIALVNGTMTGSKNYESVHQEIPNDIFAHNSEQTLNIKGFQEIGIGPISGPVHIASLETFSLPKYQSHGKVSRFKKLLNDRSLYMTNNNSRGNMDNIPGGWFDSNNQLAAPVLAGSPHNINFTLWSFIARRLGFEMIGFILDLFGDDYWSLRKLKPVSSFIASYSAIGHLSPDQNWAQALDKNLVCQNLTPFDSYFGHDINTQHTTFNTEARIWLISEVEGTTLEPYFPINPNNLVGSSLVCNNSIRTYTFNNCTTPGDVVNWQAGGGFYVLSSTTNSITVQTPSAGGGNQGWIKATFTNGASVTKNVWIGVPEIPNSLNGPSSVHNGAIVQYFGGTARGASSYKWELPVPFTVTSSINGNSMTWNMTPTTGRNLLAMAGHQGAEGYLRYRGVNFCGDGFPQTMFISRESGCGIDPSDCEFIGGLEQRKQPSKIVYPNPANNSLTINVTRKTKSERFTATLQDLSGRTLLRKNFKDTTITLNTSRLKNGYYVLKVVSGSQSITKKVLVQH